MHAAVTILESELVLFAIHRGVAYYRMCNVGSVTWGDYKNIC